MNKAPNIFWVLFFGILSIGETRLKRFLRFPMFCWKLFREFQRNNIAINKGIYDYSVRNKLFSRGSTKDVTSFKNKKAYYETPQ